MIEPDALAYIEETKEVMVDGGKFDGSVTTAAAALSIAISLKRIADEVCGVPYDPAPGADNSKHSAGITAGIQMAIEQGIAAASQRG